MIHKQLVSQVKRIFNKIPDKSVKNAYNTALKRGNYTVLSVVAPVFLEVVVSEEELNEFKELITKLKEYDNQTR